MNPVIEKKRSSQKAGSNPASRKPGCGRSRTNGQSKPRGKNHPSPALELIRVPLSQLRPSQHNVRQRPGTVDALAESIARVGLLQNLAVIPAADGLHYEVVAGRRRLAAFKLLVKQRRLDADWRAPCLVVQDASARTVSLTENLQREAMHPADQFEAFAALVAEGRPIEDIAADFGVTPLVVQRRLKLANVSPRLIADYRADKVTLDQLMALAITDDHARQEAAFYEVPPFQRGPAALRAQLTANEIDLSHPLVRFTGLEAYQAAGGSTRQDLFAQGDAEIYVCDTALLQMLARQKLETLAAPVRAEGWAWVEVALATTLGQLQEFQRTSRQRRAPDENQEQQIAQIQAEMRALDQDIETAMEKDDEDEAQALQEQSGRLRQQLHELEDGLLDYAPEARALSGAIVTIGREGELQIHRGLLREAEAKVLRTLQKQRQDSASGHAHPENTPPDQTRDLNRISDRLAQQLSAHRTAALQIELARHHRVALAALVQGMVQKVLQPQQYGRDLPLGVSLTVKDRMEKIAPDWPESPAALALRQLKEEWSGRLPGSSGQLLMTLMTLDLEELVKLLALCVACTVDVVTPRYQSTQPGAELAQAVELDMTAWWKPTALSYFNHVSKAAILQAVGQFAPEHVKRLDKLKKAGIASEAERLVEGKGWMPAFFKPEKVQEAAPWEEPRQEPAAQTDEQTGEITGEINEEVAA